MSAPFITTIGPWQLGAADRLTEGQVRQLQSLLAPATGSAPAVLGGRAPVRSGRLAGIGDVVVKTYCRGGLIRHWNRHRYLRLGTTRCALEYEMLAAVRHIGVGAPQPVAFVVRGGLWYRCGLVTRMLPTHASLADISRNDTAGAATAVAGVADQLRILIRHRILHVDLHPGNVLVDSHQRVYLIDFDRARRVAPGEKRLRRRYLRRWRRAVRKHRLPDELWTRLDEIL
jgi:serine/threonine protein kinase